MLIVGWIAVALASGTLHERLECADGTHAYALYRPEGHDRYEAAPLLVVMDPRGRAVEAAEPFFAAADAYGWVVASSYDTRSDVMSGPDPNGPAVAALLDDVPTRVRVDGNAVVLAGFSGTARVAWAVGTVLPDVVYAVMSVGAGVARGVKVQEVPFSVFFAAGRRDFNYQEAAATEADLADLGVARRIEVFDGGHQWPPAEVSARMLGWAEAEGQRLGRRPADDARIDFALAADRAWLATITDPWEAGRAHDAVARTYDGLRDVSAEHAEAARLLATPEARARRKQEARLARGEAMYRTRIGELSMWLAAPERTPPTPAEGRYALGADPLLARAEGQGPEADAAARTLALTYAVLVHYGPAAARADGDYGDAAPSLAIAAALWPDDPLVHYDLACAWALAGRPGSALDSLEDAVAHGFSDRAYLVDDPDLVSLHDDPRFTALVARLAH